MMEKLTAEQLCKLTRNEFFNRHPDEDRDVKYDKYENISEQKKEMAEILVNIINRREQEWRDEIEKQRRKNGE